MVMTALQANLLFGIATLIGIGAIVFIFLSGKKKNGSTKAMKDTIIFAILIIFVLLALYSTVAPYHWADTVRSYFNGEYK
ncbi:MAG: hypothetical protein ACRC41_01330 [Sarcina sp.]